MMRESPLENIFEKENVEVVRDKYTEGERSKDSPIPSIYSN